eukprot:SAG22_NODE_225_length_14728_cov_58.742361_10_plen_186_part_00
MQDGTAFVRFPDVEMDGETVNLSIARLEREHKLAGAVAAGVGVDPATGKKSKKPTSEAAKRRHRRHTDGAPVPILDPLLGRRVVYNAAPELGGELGLFRGEVTAYDPAERLYQVRTKALSFCCASTGILSKALPFRAVCPAVPGGVRRRRRGAADPGGAGPDSRGHGAGAHDPGVGFGGRGGHGE